VIAPRSPANGAYSQCSVSALAQLAREYAPDWALLSLIDGNAVPPSEAARNAPDLVTETQVV
jgi:hypothetical protein